MAPSWCRKATVRARPSTSCNSKRSLRHRGPRVELIDGRARDPSHIVRRLQRDRSTGLARGAFDQQCAGQQIGRARDGGRPLVLVDPRRSSGKVRVWPDGSWRSSMVQAPGLRFAQQIQQSRLVARRDRRGHGACAAGEFDTNGLAGRRRVVPVEAAVCDADASSVLPDRRYRSASLRSVVATRADASGLTSPPRANP